MARTFFRNIQASHTILINNDILFGAGAGAPAATEGATIAGPGSLYFDTTNKRLYINTGTKAVPVWSISSVEDTLSRYAEVTLTNAQVLAIRATPITMVAAPGAGKKLVFLSAALNVNGTAGAYTETTDNLQFKYVDGSGVAVSEAVETTGFIDQAGKMHTSARAKLDGIATEAQSVNVPIVLHNTGDGEFGGGNAANTLKVSTLYRVITTI